MKNAGLSLLILALAAVGACNRDRTPQAAAPNAPVNQPSSQATQPKAPPAGSVSSSTQQESPSRELSKQDEANAMPRPGQGGSDHSTPAREPGAKG